MGKSLTPSYFPDSGFVVLPGANTFWTDLFVRHFLFETDASVQESDDLLFFVRYKHVKGSSRINPKFEVSPLVTVHQVPSY